MREQSGALAPPSFDENKLRQSKKGGVMGTVFAGRAYKLPEVNYELSLEMNKKMQSVLEDTLLKNITLKVWMGIQVHSWAQSGMKRKMAFEKWWVCM